MTALDTHLNWLRSQSLSERHSRYCLDLAKLLGDQTGPVPCSRTSCVSCGSGTILPTEAAGKRPWGLCRECMGADGADLRLRTKLVQEAERDQDAAGPKEAFAAMRYAAERFARRARGKR